MVAGQAVGCRLRDRSGCALLFRQPLAEGRRVLPAELPSWVLRSLIPAVLAPDRFLARPLPSGRLDEGIVVASARLPGREQQRFAALRRVGRSAGDLYRQKTHSQRIFVGTLAGDRDRGLVTNGFGSRRLPRGGLCRFARALLRHLRGATLTTFTTPFSLRLLLQHQETTCRNGQNKHGTHGPLHYPTATGRLHGNRSYRRTCFCGCPCRRCLRSYKPGLLHRYQRTRIDHDLVEIVAKLGGILVTLVRIDLQGFRHDGVVARVEILYQLTGRSEHSARNLTGQQLVKHGSHSIEVGSSVHGSPRLQRLWCDVIRRSHGHVGHRQPWVVGR